MKNINVDKKMEKLLDFVNFDSKSEDADQFLVFAKKYVDFAYQDEEALKKHQILTKSTFSKDEANGANEMLGLLEDLQAHLVKILDSIIYSKIKSEPIEIKGVKKITFKNQKMVETFETEKIKTSTISLETEKKIMEASFVDLLSKDEIAIKRFKRCQNDRCGKFIYKVKKLYCSDRCGNAFRQRHKTIK